MTKEELALEVVERLKKEYPEAGCTLDYNQAWKLLDLYAKYPDVESLAEADVDDIERIVKPCGLGHSKARDISGCMKMLRDEFGGKVPDDFDALMKLPGVGRKSANLIMGDVFGKPAIVTDTHCIRLVNRIGLVDGVKEPKKVEMALWKLIPPEEGSDFCHRLVFHGRDVCTARTKPFCEGYLWEDWSVEVMGEIAKMVNLGEVIEKQLGEVGITTAEQLRETGSKQAWLKIKAIDDSACIHRLLAMEGAIRGVKKTALPEDVKEDLREFYRAAK